MRLATDPSGGSPGLWQSFGGGGLYPHRVARPPLGDGLLSGLRGSQVTRVVTGAALLGVLQGVLLVVLLGPLQIGTTGWFLGRAWASTALVDPERPLILVPLALALLAGAVIAVARRLGWLGPRTPSAGSVSASRVGVAGVVIAVVAISLDPMSDGTYAVAGLPFNTSRFVAVEQPPVIPWWMIGWAVIGAGLLVLLAALREGHPWARAALGVVVMAGVAAQLVQVLVLGGVGSTVLALQVIVLALGAICLVLSLRRSRV